MTLKKRNKISIIGQGYVGLPLSIELGKKFKEVVGFDNSKVRINQLIKNIDSNKEIKKNDFKKSKNLKFTFNENEISDSDFFIITVPTPIDQNNKPDLKSLKKASEIVGKKIKKNNIVIYESTVFPGCTEEVCIPILEKFSKLKFNEDFFCGYSPERINVGDKRFILRKVKKIVSGSTPKTAEKVNNLYKKIITAGTYLAKSIIVAEAAKVIENTQRDLNIALSNELSIIFDRLKIDTEDVLNAASTKWNFVKYKPGLVGGHCIGVDPYYLTYKSQKLGYDPKIILSGRKVNDQMSMHIFKRIIKLMKKKKIKIKNSKILLLGCSFKKNCTDTRNSKVFDLANHFSSVSNNIEIYDPWVDYNNLKKRYKFKFLSRINKRYDVVILAVGHDIFKKLTHTQIRKISKNKNVIFDVKSFFNPNIVSDRL